MKTKLKLYGIIISLIILIIISIYYFFIIDRSEKLVKVIDLTGKWQFREPGKGNWLQGTVPGTVHTDLLANKKIPPPFYKDNEKKLQWIGHRDWEYKKEFILDSETLKKDFILLQFDGLDTIADVYINDQKCLKADNMFRSWSIDCRKMLKEGLNTIRVVFHSPFKTGSIEYDKYPYQYPASNDQAPRFSEKKISPFIRKAPYHFGWDWGPRFITMGIWRPVRMLTFSRARIEDLYLVTHQLNTTRASMYAEITIHSKKRGSGLLSLYCQNKKIKEESIRLKPGLNRVNLPFELRNPRLWWPNGLGDQYLYTLTAKLHLGNYYDQKSRRIGLRNLKLVREKDARGESFYFRINDSPLFIKGANYIPNDIFLPRIARDAYRKVVSDARSANMNMLRIWGGGIYENDYFYDLCDEQGILIWQDFMFACSMYPGNKEFLNNIREEARDNIIRLRNHPSLALWCGNNEMETAWHHWGWKREIAKKTSQKDADKVWEEYQAIFHELLPEMVQKYDPQRAYWPSSPARDLDPDTHDTSLTQGDYHYWGVWHGEKPFSDFLTNIPRFMSEYGFQSFPSFQTVKTYTTDEDWNIESPVMRFHQRHPRGNFLIRKYMVAEYNIPSEFKSFLYLSQVQQAYGIKTAIEAHRRAMPYCMGTLYWQLNDCWPVASWSSTDYYKQWKALHYFVQKAYSSLLISPVKDNDELNVFLVSDFKNTVKGNISLKLIDFEGNILRKKILACEVKPNTSGCHLTIPQVDLLGKSDPAFHLLLAEFVTSQGVRSQNILYFSPAKNLKLINPDFKTKFKETDKGYKITLSSPTLAKNVYLSLVDSDGFFSDNYFDLIPGEQKEIKLVTDQNLQQVKEKLEILTLYDARN